MGENKGELIQPSFVKNLIFGVFGETKLFETFSRKPFFLKCQLKFSEDVPYGDGFSSKLRIIADSKATTIVIFLARRRRKFWQDLAYKSTFFLIKTMI